jgi:hypothetical protein
MRWFTDEAYKAEAAEWDAMLAAYDTHLREIADRLPPELAMLATDPRLNLHDARIRSIVFDREESAVEMNLTIAGDFRAGLYPLDLRLVFGCAQFVPDEPVDVRYAVTATYGSRGGGTTRTAILAGEIDISEDGRYVLRLRLWPFHEFGLAFDTLSLSEGPATPDDGQAGSFSSSDDDDDDD